MRSWVLGGLGMCVNYLTEKKNYMKFNVLLSVLRSSPDALHCRMELELHMDTVKDNI